MSSYIFSGLFFHDSHSQDIRPIDPNLRILFGKTLCGRKQEGSQGRLNEMPDQDANLTQVKRAREGWVEVSLTLLKLTVQQSRQGILEP